VLRDLTKKGFEILPVHPAADEIDGFQCYPTVGDLPKPVGGLILVVPPPVTETVVREARSAGIERVWMQPGAESPEAIRYCEENGIDAIHGACIMMFAEPRGIHKLHRWLRGVLGKLPDDAG
jgi:hypothetical protein